MNCKNCKRNFDNGCPYPLANRPEDCKYFKEMKEEGDANN